MVLAKSNRLLSRLKSSKNWKLNIFVKNIGISKAEKFMIILLLSKFNISHVLMISNYSMAKINEPINSISFKFRNYWLVCGYYICFDMTSLIQFIDIGCWSVVVQYFCTERPSKITEHPSDLEKAVYSYIFGLVNIH